jgi:uncharacterized circularly permuted ATP-grasp superfamily protein
MGGFLLDGYDPGGFYCELLRSVDNLRLRDRLARLPITDFKRRAASAEQALYNLGITFTVYSDNNAIDRILPFDAIPRVLSAAEWVDIERGVIQRVTALNLLLDDLYHEQKILKDRVIPTERSWGMPIFGPRYGESRSATRRTSTSAASTSSAIERALFRCSRIMRARRPASAM